MPEWPLLPDLVHRPEKLAEAGTRFTAQRAGDMKVKFLVSYTDCPSLSNSKVCDFNGNNSRGLDFTETPKEADPAKRVGECREMALRERNRLSFPANASTDLLYSGTLF